MIDTIVFSIHNCAVLYPNLLKILNNASYHKTLNSDRPLHHDYQIMVDSKKGNVKNKITFSSLQSSHSKIVAFIDDRSIITFNFSIPKYLYGNNVMQFLHGIGAIGTLNNIIDYDIQKELSYSKLIAFIASFLKSEFPTISIKFSDIEIKRIDLCFNEIYSSIDNALNALEAKKQIKKKWERDGMYHPFKTSIFYKTKDYSAKIYHKGSEFEKNDYNKVLKNNGQQVADDLQNLANKILRYEMSFRPSYLSKITYDKIIDYPYFRILKRINNDLNVIEEKGISFTDENQLKKHLEKWNAIYRVQKVPVIDYITFNGSVLNTPLKNLINEIKKYRKIISSTIKFTLDIRHNTNVNNYEIYSQQKLEKFENIIFSKQILLCLFQEFDKFHKNFLINEIPDNQKFIEKMNNYESKLSKKIDRSKYSLLFELIKAGTTIEKFAQVYDIPKTTYYRLKKVMSNLDINDNSFKSIEIPEKNYRKYIFELKTSTFNKLITHR